MQRAIVVDVGRADNEVLNGGHHRVPAECLPIMEVNADEPCRPAHYMGALSTGLAHMTFLIWLSSFHASTRMRNYY